MPLHRLRASLNPAHHWQFASTFVREVGAIRKLLRRGDFDVVQINGLVNPHAAFAATAEGRAVVWQILDTYPPMRVRRVIMALVRRLADVLMCTGRRVAAAHPGALAFGDRLVTFFPPVNSDVFSPRGEVREAVRREFGFGEQDFVVGTVSNVNMQKGHDVFVRAAGRLKQLVPNARFVILGATYPHFRSYADQLFTEAARFGLCVGQDFVVMDPGQRVPELEQAFDVFWLTSRPNSEGIPTAVEEAMTLGIPVVAFDVGAVAEAVEDGICGFVVPCNDAESLVTVTSRLARDQGARGRMGQAARRIALERFSHVVCAEAHLVAYAKAIQHASRRRARKQ
jgi:glycosyltransferase involved in cell wall biosynthesis